MLSPDISKLAEKLARDPSSKLFIPLAEEYRRSGMLDEAIQVLSDCLKANPNYMTARVSLGKMLLEKGNIMEAQIEFEKVVQAVPDNLFAHKKLAEIYQKIGDMENLLKEYKIIISLSPKDKDVMKAIDDLEGNPAKMTPVVETTHTVEIDKSEDATKKSLIEELATETMAEIYIKQGLYEKADEIYQQILGSEPGNIIIRQKRAELVSLMNIIKGEGS
ncbi:MAG: tetratricopeptide repeat protein [Nitrospirota bacterium]